MIDTGTRRVIARQDGQSLVFRCDCCGEELFVALIPDTIRYGAEFTLEHLTRCPARQP